MIFGTQLGYTLRHLFGYIGTSYICPMDPVAAILQNGGQIKCSIKLNFINNG